MTSSSDSNNQERRQFSRIVFDGDTRLNQGDQHWEVSLVDLSLQGLLIETPPDWHADRDAPFDAAITLADDTVIRMALNWRHTDRSQSGFECKHIDIDSITHLRRLVELNLGDPQLLERELAALGN